MINDILKLLAETPSTNDKLKILKENKDNRLLKLVIVQALNPFIIFNMKKVPERGEYDPWNERAVTDLYTAIKRLNILSNIEDPLRGNKAKEFIQTLLNELSSEDAEVITKILKKDLRCGVNTSLVNKVWDKLIPTHAVMLCAKYDQKLINKLQFPLYVQLKKDGMRFSAVIENGKIQLFSRNGKLLEGLFGLEQELLQLSNDDNVVLDGELLVKDLDRKAGNGVLNKILKGTATQLEMSDVTATLWDYIPLEDYKNERSDSRYMDRMFILLNNLEELQLSRVEILSSILVDDMEQVNKLFNTFLSKGEEGIILKDPNGIWENKRVNHQIKFKNELTADLLVVEEILGEGKYKELLGSVLCTTSDGILTVNVGSGFNDIQRKELLGKLKGKIIEVKYNELIKNKSGGTSLFLPIFMNIREDKNIANSIKDL